MVLVGMVISSLKAYDPGTDSNSTLMAEMFNDIWGYKFILTLDCTDNSLLKCFQFTFS